MSKYYNTIKEKMVLYEPEELDIEDIIGLIIGNQAEKKITKDIANIPYKKLLNMKTDDFLQYKGIGPITARRLEAVMLFTKKMSKMRVDSENKYKILSPDDAFQYFRYLMYEVQENLVSLYLDTKNNVIKRKTIYIGGLDSSILHPREVFKEAISYSASRIILAHNHPSGDPTPSREDIKVTQRFCEVGNIIGIDVLDHIVIGENKYVSLKAKGHI